MSIFLNGISSRLLPLSPTAIAVRCAAAGGGEVSLGPWLLASMLSPVQVLAHGRAVSLYIIFAFLLWRERKAASAATDAVATPASTAIVATRSMTAAERERALASVSRLDRFALQLMTPSRWVACQAYGYCIGIGILNTIAYAGYMALTSLAEVSLWTALIGLFAVLPVCWGILMRGESKTPRKLAGVGLCIVAGILLGMSGANGSSSAPDDGAAVGGGDAPAAPGTAGGDAPAPAPAIHASMFIKLCLYCTAVVGWALSDGMSTLVLAPAADAKLTPGSSASNAAAASSSGASPGVPVATGAAAVVAIPAAPAPAAVSTAVAAPHSWASDPWAASGAAASTHKLAATGAGGEPPQSQSQSLPLSAAGVGSREIYPVASAYAQEVQPEPLLPPPLRLNIATISLLTGLGFSLAAGAAGGLSMITTAIVPLPVGPGTPAPVAACFATQSASAAAMAASWSYIGGLTLLFAAQFLGKVAWWACTQVGQLAEVSAVIPLVSLDVFVPVLLSILLLGEKVGTAGWIGFVFAAAGVTLISLSST